MDQRQDQIDRLADPPENREDEPRAPTGWLWLNDRYIEVPADDAQRLEVTPPAPPDGDEVAPGIDWDSVAGAYEDVRVLRIPAQALREGDRRYNVVVRPGDIIRLYSGNIGFFYVTGHVRRPGVFAFRSGASITLKNAIAGAAGLDALGWPDRVTVYRRVGEREQMIQVNLDRIYAGKDPDFFLKRDDIVNVGTHPFAPFLLQIRNFTIPQMGGSISYFYRYSRQETFFKTENLNQPNTPNLFP